MSQATQSKGKPGQSSGGPRGKRPVVYGRGPPGGANDKPRRPRREPVVEVWVQKLR